MPLVEKSIVHHDVTLMSHASIVLNHCPGFCVFSCASISKRMSTGTFLSGMPLKKSRHCLHRSTPRTRNTIFFSRGPGTTTSHSSDCHWLPVVWLVPVWLSSRHFKIHFISILSNRLMISNSFVPHDVGRWPQTVGWILTCGYWCRAAAHASFACRIGRWVPTSWVSINWQLSYVPYLKTLLYFALLYFALLYYTVFGYNFASLC